MSLSHTGKVHSTTPNPIPICWAQVNWTLKLLAGRTRAQFSFLTVVKFGRGGFQLFSSPPGRPASAPPPGFPGCWHTAPSWTAGCWEYWCCPPCGKQTQRSMKSLFKHHCIYRTFKTIIVLFHNWGLLFMAVAVIHMFNNDTVATQFIHTRWEHH